MLTVDVSFIRPLFWDFKTPKKTDKGVCATERVLETYEKKCPDRPLQTQFLGVQKALQKEEAAIKNVKGNIMDLKSNIKDRDKLAETQDKTICILQNSLKICQDEAEELHKTIHCLEVRKCEIETESKQKIQELKSKVSQLQNCLKKYEEVNKNHQKTEEALKSTIASLKENIYKEQKKYSELEKKNDLLENCKTSSNEAQDRAIDSLQNSLETTQNEISKLHKINECLEREKADIEKDHKEQIKKLKDKICELQNNMKSSEETTEYTEDDSLRKLQNANLELAILAGHLQEDYRNAESKLSEVYQQFRSNETKHHKSEAALQLVISNLKETICKERKKCCEIEKDNKKLQEQVKELEDYSKNATKSNKETADKISDLEKQVMCWSKQALDVEGKLKSIQEKLCKSLNREKELELEMSLKESKYKEEICGKLKEINNLTNAIQSLTEKLSESTTELDKNRLRLQSVCGAYEELKVKEREKEAQADKLQVALTQLSNKFVSRHLDTGTSHCLRHYQEECAKYEALYNTTACKLRSKELEISSLKQEVERLRSEMDHVAMTTLQQKEDESCPFLMERVHQLSKELQVAHSCQNSYESLLKDIREKYSKKEDENFQLKAQIKQITLQRDAVLADLEKAQEEISRFKINNSNQLATIKRLEQNNAQISEQLHKVMYDSDTAGLPQFQPNIELQREISTALSSQLRGVKQKLHSTKHDYKLLQTAYEELNRKYTSLQRGERDLEQKKEMLPTSKPVPRCRPCLAKSSKSVTYIKMPESMGAQDPVHLEYLSHSKSWHKMNNNKDLDWKERKWKQKLQNVIRGDFSPSEAMHHSSSSN